MSDESWTKNPALGNIDPARLQMLLGLAEQARGKNQTELMSLLMSVSAASQTGDMAFKPSEADAIIEAMKVGKSPQEIQRIDRLCALVRQFRR